MTQNTPLTITVNRNLASTLRTYIKQNGGKNVSEAQMNQILKRVAEFDAERDKGVREGGSIFEGGTKYLGGDNNNFRVKQGQKIKLSVEEYNKIFEGFIQPLAAKGATEVNSTSQKDETQKNSKEETTTTLADDKNASVVKKKAEEAKPTNKDNKKVDTLNDEQIANEIKKIFPKGLPAGVTVSSVKIGGLPTLIYKKNGQTLDKNQISKLISEQQNDTSVATSSTSSTEASQRPTPPTVKKEDPKPVATQEKPVKDVKEEKKDTKPTKSNVTGTLATSSTSSTSSTEASQRPTPPTVKKEEPKPVNTQEKPVKDVKEEKKDTKPAKSNVTGTLATSSTGASQSPTPPTVRKEDPKPVDTKEKPSENSTAGKNYGLGKISTPFQASTLEMLYNNQNVKTNFLKNANNFLGTVEYKNQYELNESSKSKTQIALIGKYGTSDHQWCAHAVSTIAEQSGVNIGGHKAQVQQFINWAKQKGLYNPIASTGPITKTNFENVRASRADSISKQMPDMNEGDLIIWKSKYAAKTNEGINFWNSSHIGILEDVDLENGTVTVLEGNANIPKSDDQYERYIVRNSAQGKVGDQQIGEPEELNRTDGLIRKVYTIQDLANFGYSGYINMQKLV